MDTNISENSELPPQLPDWLRKIPVLAMLDDAQAAKLIAAGTRRQWPADHRLHNQGEACNGLQLICDGQLSYTSSQGYERKLTAGEHFGSTALFAEQHYPCQIISDESTVIFELSREAFAELLYEDERLIAQLLENIESMRSRNRAALLHSHAASDADSGLSAISYFSGLDPLARKLLLTFGQQHSSKAGDIVCGEGDELGLLLLQSGSLRVDEIGQVSQQLQAGGSYGAQALLRSRRMPGTVLCTEDARLIRISRRNFISALQASAPLYTAVFDAFAAWLPSLVDEAAHQPKQGDIAGEGPLRGRLQQSEFFQNWEPEQLDQLLQQASYRSLARGELLFEHGDAGQEMFLILDGAIQVRFHDDNGVFVDLATLQTGDTVGEMALIDSAPRSADAVAVANSELLCVNRDGFTAMLERSPGLISALLVGLSSMLRQSNEWRAEHTEGFTSITAEQAVHRVTCFRLLDQPSRLILADAGRELELAGGELLFEEGDTADSMYVILSGGIDILGFDEDGQEQVMSSLHVGDVFGEIALIDNAARSACARARETSRFFALDREVFLELLSQTPPLLTQVLRGLSAKVRTANAKNRELQAQLA